MCHRLPSPHRRTSPSLKRHRSPRIWHRSPSPVRRRSYAQRHRSPSPVRDRSPSPVRVRSPSQTRLRSPCPVHRQCRRSSSISHHVSLSPVRKRSHIYGHRRAPSISLCRSPSRYGWSSASSVQHGSPPVTRKLPKHRSSSVQSPRQRIQTQEELSLVRQVHKEPDPVARLPLISLRSPQRDPMNQRGSHIKVSSLSASQNKSPSLPEAPRHTRNMSPSEDQRSSSSHESLLRKTKEQMNLDGNQSPPHISREQKYRYDSPGTDGENKETNSSREEGYAKHKSLQMQAHSPKVGKAKDFPVKVHYKENHSSQVTDTQSYPSNAELRRKDHETKSEKTTESAGHPYNSDQRKSTVSCKDSSKGKRKHLSDYAEGYEAYEKAHSYSENAKDNNRYHKSAAVPKLKVAEKVGHESRSTDSGSEESNRHKAEVTGKSKHKNSYGKDGTSDDGCSFDSEIEDRKEAKRRRREEKQLRKEGRHRRREERRHKREERHTRKLKAKSTATVQTPSDSEKNQTDACASDGEHGARRYFCSSDAEETESEHKKLEIELRKRALKLLRAKKGISR